MGRALLGAGHEGNFAHFASRVHVMHTYVPPENLSQQNLLTAQKTRKNGTIIEIGICDNVNILCFRVSAAGVQEFA